VRPSQRFSDSSRSGRRGWCHAPLVPRRTVSSRTDAAGDGPYLTRPCAPDRPGDGALQPMAMPKARE
jgi:hypothetical protein